MWHLTKVTRSKVPRYQILLLGSQEAGLPTVRVTSEFLHFHYYNATLPEFYLQA